MFRFNSKLSSCWFHVYNSIHIRLNFQWWFPQEFNFLMFWYNKWKRFGVFDNLANLCFNCLGIFNHPIPTSIGYENGSIRYGFKQGLFCAQKLRFLLNLLFAVVQSLLPGHPLEGICWNFVRSIDNISSA